jgi:hypothetical protein
MVSLGCISAIGCLPTIRLVTIMFERCTRAGAGSRSRDHNNEAVPSLHRSASMVQIALPRDKRRRWRKCKQRGLGVVTQMFTLLGFLPQAWIVTSGSTLPRQG